MLLNQTSVADVVKVVDEAFRGSPTEVAVLGTAHLAELGDRFTPGRLEPLIQRLERWRPAVITVENVTGRDCDEAKARPDLFTKGPARWCEVAFKARNLLGVDQYGAEKRIDGALQQRSDLSPAHRRELAALFLAAGERGSALVQWLRLPAAERRSDTLLDQDLVAALEQYRTSANETYSLGSVLAARLGLDRLIPIDDSTSGRHVSKLGQPYVERLMAIWKNPAASRAAAERERKTEHFLRSGDVLDYYRWLNAPGTLEAQMRADFAAAAADVSPDRTGRLYLANWEARNLNMVANIRIAFGDRPGARVLSIVGSSHKPYFERYLATQSDLRIVDVTSLLR